MPAATRKIGPACPHCDAPVPFWRTQWRLGKAFDCTACGQAMLFPRQFAVPLLAIAAWWVLKPERGTGTLGDHLLVIGPIVLALLLHSYLLMTPRKA